MMLLKCCTQYASIFGKHNGGHKTGKSQFSFPKKSNAKECSNYCTIACQQSNAENSPSKASTLSEPRTFKCSCWIQKNPTAEKPEIKMPTSVRSQKKQENSR